MPLPADYHMHTPLCRHAVGEPAEYARQAVAAGLTEIGFSDHSPMRQDNFDEWRMRLNQLDEYVANVQRTQKDFPQLTIKLALEVDYFPGQEDWIRELASRHPWDYFIGSVHYVSDSWAVDDPHKLSEWKHHDAGKVWAVYFERLTMAAESGLFEIIGHADLPKKFGHRAPDNRVALYERFLGAASKHGVAMELNTAGLRKDCREIYPSAELVRLAFQRGVAITFGSDAHAPGEVAMNFAEAIASARAAGYTHSCQFTRRQKTVARF
jgi:histidinol-phosphatase (PHP family)